MCRSSFVSNLAPVCANACSSCVTAAVGCHHLGLSLPGACETWQSLGAAPSKGSLVPGCTGRAGNPCLQRQLCLLVLERRGLCVYFSILYVNKGMGSGSSVMLNDICSSASGRLSISLRMTC